MYSGNSALNAQISPLEVILEHALLEGGKLHTLGSELPTLGSELPT